MPIFLSGVGGLFINDVTFSEGVNLLVTNIINLKRGVLCEVILDIPSAISFFILTATKYFNELSDYTGYKFLFVFH